MAEPSDWEPLPDEQLTLHPGEIATVAPAAAPAVAAAQPPAATEHPEAARLLQQLQDRLAKAPPAQSLVAEVARGEARQLRQRRAAQAPQLAECRPVQGPRDGEVPLAVEFEAGEHGRDPREDEGWFQALPLTERQRLQTAWARRRVQQDCVPPAERRSKNQRTTAAIVVFAAVMLLGSHERWHATLGAGICCGIWWRHAGPCRYRYPVIAFVCLLLAQLIAWAADGGQAPRLLFMDSVLLTALAAAVGFDGEIRRSGGFDRGQ